MSTNTKTLGRQSMAYSLSYQLICGYIREAEQKLDDKIVPASINMLCWRFYYLHNFLLCLCCKPQCIKIADIHNNNDKEKVVHTESGLSLGSLFITHCCTTNKLNASHFPPAVVNEYNFNALSTTVIFKCGGWPTASCHALFVDTNSLNNLNLNANNNNNNNNTNTNTVYNWRLPTIDRSSKSQPYGNSIAFSSKDQRLLSVGGNGVYGDTLLALQFSGSFTKDEEEKNENEKNESKKEEEEEEWQWREIAKLPCNRYNSSAVVMERDNKLIVLGGKKNEADLNTAIAYDFEQQQWNQLASFEYARRAAGACADHYAHRVYLAGGIEQAACAHSVEWLDVYKDEWNLLPIPPTRFAHRLHPAVWMENNCMLFVASVGNARGKYGSKLDHESKNCCEWIDLREANDQNNNNNAWNTLEENDVLSQVFGFKQKVSSDDVYLVATS